MSRGLMVVVCALAVIGGCKDKDNDKGGGGGGGSKSRVPAPPTGDPKVTLDPEPTPPDKLPAPEPGYLRISAFDLDVKGTGRTGADENQVNVDAGTCYPRIVVDIAPIDADAYLKKLGTKKVLRKEARPDGWLLEYTSEGATDSQLVVAGKVAASHFVCDVYIDAKREGNRACAEEICGSVRAVPGGSLEKPYPTGEPVIETSSGGGIDGGSRGGVRIWEDGTFHFHGPSCKQWRGRTGKLDAAAMAALIDAVRTADVGTIPEEEDSGGADCVGIGVTVRLDGKRRSAGHSQCNDKIDPTLDAVFDWIRATVGRNPCVY